MGWDEVVSTFADKIKSFRSLEYEGKSVEREKNPQYEAGGSQNKKIQQKGILFLYIL